MSKAKSYAELYVMEFKFLRDMGGQEQALKFWNEHKQALLDKGIHKEPFMDEIVIEMKKLISED